MMGNIVFVGAGGSGISAIAKLFLQLGYDNLLGLDKNKTEVAEQLENQGLEVRYEFGKYQVQPDDFVIYSAARDTVPEVKQAKQLVGSNHKKVLPPMLYFEFLGELSKYFTTISVTGTHGKSTTTAMIGVALAQHHTDFGLSLLGAGVTDRNSENMYCNPTHQQQIQQIVEHIISPKGPAIADQMKELLFVVEADEYNQHFLYLDTDYGVITSMELDHSDIYPTEQDYVNAYIQFAQQTRQLLVMQADQQFVDQFTDIAKLQKITTQQFSFTHLIGGHNHSNAALAVACCQAVGLDQQDATTAIEQMHGLRRRAEPIGSNNNGAQIVSDYAHHPTEIASTYTALQEKYPDKELICVFQPHQVRRVLEFWDEFVAVLREIDTCYLYDIYAAREDFTNLKEQFANEATRTVSSVDQLGNLLASTTGQTYTTEFSEIIQLLEQATDDQLVVLFSAGGIDYETRNWLASKQ